MRRKDSRMDGPIRSEQLEFLAAISPEWREEKRRRERAGAEAAHQQEIDNFVRAITVPDWSHRGPSSTSGATQEFVEAITRPAWPNGERPMTSEEVQTFVDSITRHDGPAIYEAGWDPAKHPRVPAGQPGGGQWTSAEDGRSGSTLSNSSSDRETMNDSAPTSNADQRFSANRSPSQRSARDDSDRNDRRTQATTAEFSPSQGAMAHLTGPNSVGHHWVPQSVFNDLAPKLTKKALEIFALGTEDPGGL
ncbi:MAG TPA: hypothetical protein VHD36_09995 [Pirellulales bacterium]|nr:hypothetical protein [Pirellulales bacterium]